MSFTSHKPTVTIIQASGGELANQLWNYISIYAYCLEKGYKLENPSFYEYGTFFELPRPNFIYDIALFRPFTGYTKRKWSFKKRLWRKAYKLFSDFYIYLTRPHHIHIPDNKHPFYMAPSPAGEHHHTLHEKLAKLESSNSSIVLSGWLFRNPIGIEKYRTEIRSYIRPSRKIAHSVNQFLRPLRESFKNIIGVHIRQGDYATWHNGAYFVNQERVCEILREFIAQRGINSGETCFVIASDGPINTSLFSEFTIKITGKSMVEDLYILAGTDAVIGSNSTFGDFAAYYGNIPHIIFEKGPMDWPYYASKNTFFPNKYCTWVHY